jgi:hypothetical protein
MRPSRMIAALPLLATLAVLAFAGPAFARGSIDRQVVQAACMKGFYRAGQARCLRFAGSRSVHVIVSGRVPDGDVVDGDVVDGDVVDGKRPRLIGARSAVVKANDLDSLAAAFGVRRIALDATGDRNSADTWG